LQRAQWDTTDTGNFRQGDFVDQVLAQYVEPAQRLGASVFGQRSQTVRKGIGDRTPDYQRTAPSVCNGKRFSFDWSGYSIIGGAFCVTYDHDQDEARPILAQGCIMTKTRVGYARCSTDKQDLAAQRTALLALDVAEDRIYTDHGLTGTNRERPGLAQALAAVREGDTLVVPKLDRLARSVPDARAIADELEKRGVKLALGASVHDPTDPMGKMFFNILATFAEFEADLIRMRTKEGMAIARAKGRLKGKKPKLSDRRQAELRRMYDTGDYSISDLAELFDVSRPTVYRVLQRTPSADASSAAV
tara:strand:+ start:111 stop:1022 length:912 start_codon:yes stop_codon:yes gene_type:complete